MSRTYPDPVPGGRLPSGTLTFVFTDLRDSTRLWESRPEEMREALARHDELTVALVEAHDGHVVKLLGDGVMAVFDEAPAAVAAAHGIQRQLAQESWQVPIAARIGLHSGVAHAEGSDYHGPTVNRAARIAHAAHPGQVLVSEATATLAAGCEFRDLGEYALRGLGATRLLQLMGEGLRDDFPKLGVARRAADLPTPPTSFVGRTTEMAKLGGLLVDHRLVTITGVGGCGKTRLAIATAARLEHEHLDGARFVDLAPVTADAQVTDVVSDALGLFSEAGTTDPVGWLAAEISGRNLLCVLDNCEHVREACAELIEAIVAVPGPSRIIATSREPLAVQGEQVYLVPSLDNETEAVTLFVERAKEARAGFDLDDENRPIVAEICARLDGIALAIELAAATVAHLSPAQVLDRLDDRFRLLTGSRRRVQRQQTLAATLDWSHDLLGPEEQVVLRRLAVFPSSFSLEAAETVVEIEGIIELLGSLVAKSLVQTVDAGDRLRYRLLESVRLYAEAKLVDAGDAATSRQRHRDWVLAWLDAVPLVERLFGDVDLLAAEHASIRTALEWSRDHDEVDAIVRIAAGVDWSRSESWREGSRFCTQAYEDADALPEDLRDQLLVALYYLGPLAQISLGPWHDLDSPPIAHSTPLQCLVLAFAGRDTTIPATVGRDDALRRQAIALVENAVAQCTPHAVPWQMMCHYAAGSAHLSLLDASSADDHFAAGLALSPGATPFLCLHSGLEGYLAIARLLLGRADEALDLARTADARIRYEPKAVPPYWHHPTWMALPVALGGHGDHDAATVALHAYWATTLRSGWARGSQQLLILAGVLATQRADWETASRLFGAARLQIASTPADWILYMTYRDRVRAALAPDRARQLRDEGRAMPTDEAVALALASPD
jgi:predicted ATPase/class 3 adenylate cyclase